MANDPFAELPDVEQGIDPFTALPDIGEEAEDPFAALPDGNDPFAELPEEGPTWYEEAGRAIAHGLHSAGEAAAEFAMTPMKLALRTLTGDKTLDPFGDVLAEPIKQVEPAAPESTPGRIMESIIQFGAGMAMGGTATKIAKGTGIIAGGAKGALAEQIAFDPDEERLSNLIQSVPELQNPVTEFLAADEGDTELEARTKMALEGMGLGAVVDVLMRGLRRVRGNRKAAAEAAANAPKPKELSPKVTMEQEGLIDLSTNIAEAKRKAQVPHPTPQPTKLEGNLNIKYVDTADKVKDELLKTEELAGGFAAQRRGKISWEETRRLANMVGMDDKDLAAMPPGSIVNSESMYKARTMLVQSGEEMVETAERAVAEGTDEAYFAYAQAVARNNSIQETVSGLSAEAGRLLNQFKMVADAGGKRRAEAIKEITKYYGEENIKKSAEAIAALKGQSPEALSQAARNFNKATKWDKGVEVWVNSLLSNPVTHATNVASNSLVSLWSLPENLAAAAISVPRRLVGKGSKDVTYFREVMARGYGMVEGIVDGTRMALKVAWDPSTVLPWQKAKQEIGGNAVGGWIGKGVNLPTRLLQVEDAFFQAMDYRMRLRQEAMHTGLKQGLKGKDLARHINKVLADTPEDIALKATNEARYLTFTNPTGKVVKHIEAMARGAPQLRFVLPFIRTPTNLVKYVLERNSPLARFTKRFRDNVKAGGRASDLAYAQMGLGIGAGLTVTKLALEGYITGSGPADPEARLAWLKNHKPYSWRMSPDGEWRSYQRIEPLGMILGLGADMGLIHKGFLDGALGEDDWPEYEEVVAAYSMALSQNLTSKTWLKGLNDAIEVVMEPDKHADYWIQNMAASFIPAGLAQLARTIDPVLREARTMADKLKARLPGYSKEVAPKVDLFGDIRTIDGAWGPDMVSPFWTQKPSNYALANEMTRLEIDDIGMPSRSIRGVELDSWQYKDYAEQAGKMATNLATTFMRNPAWATMDDWAKREMIRKAFRSSRTMAGMMTIAKHNLISDVQEKQLEKFE